MLPFGVAGLDPAIRHSGPFGRHVWITGSSPVMTTEMLT
jgi:hypothetical protein